MKCGTLHVAQHCHPYAYVQVSALMINAALMYY